MNSHRWWLLFLVVPSFPATAQACPIPVFRYALERWRPSAYELVIFHKGNLTAEQEEVVNRLGQDFSATANVAITPVDLVATVDKDLLAVWGRQAADDKLPWVVLRYPEAEEKALDVWAGPLDPVSLRRTLDSDCRQKIVAHMSRGASVVFVLLESGDTAADRDATQLLSQQLARLEKKIQLPMQGPDLLPLRSELPLKVSFPVLRLSRKDAAEQTFLQMLLRGVPDLADVRGPIVFPIYGRGRLLCALHGQELSADRLHDVAWYLCAACSCREKELNPGIDLLLAADWDKLLDQPAVTDKTTPPSEIEREEEPPSQPEPWITPPSPSVSSPGLEQRRWLRLAVAGAAVLMVVSGAWALRTLTRKGHPPAGNTSPETKNQAV